MSDTNDMRRDFEVLLLSRGASTTYKGDGYVDSLSQSFWVFWQVATERATALERERCAVVCELIKETALATQNGPYDDLSNVMVRQIAHLGAGACADAIRQGGAG